MACGKRDGDYASETAARRPMLHTRMHCDLVDPHESEMGGQMRREMEVRADERNPAIPGARVEDRVRIFNEQLRDGVGGGQFRGED